MKTLLLLAGRSQRFAPLTEKSLWPFLGKPLLAHQMDRLQAGGLTDIIAVGGQHNLEEVHQLFPRLPLIEQEDLSLGMRGALLAALPSFGDEPVCIVSGNDVIDAEGYQSLIAASKKDGVDGALLAQKVRRYFPGGYLMTRNQDVPYLQQVMGVIEKPGEGKEPSDLVNIVAHIHNHPQELLVTLEDVASTRDDAYEVALTKLCSQKTYVAVPFEGRWNAVKYPWDVLDLTERFLEEKSKGKSQKAKKNSVFVSCVVHPTAVIKGDVILEEGVKVMPHASVIGPCYIGKGTVIGNNCLVRNSMIGERCVIGYGSEIVRSNLREHVWTHTTYLGDAVIGRNVAFGAGTVAANFRLDEGEISSLVQGEKIATGRTKLGVIIGNDVRVGIHAGFAPGVKIGGGSFISSATFVSRDVGENRYVHAKEGILEERENRMEVPGVRG